VKSEESVLGIKSYDFAIRIVELNKFLSKEYREYVLARQVLRSGTAVGALIREAEFGQSRADFSNKMSIALKEANETQYWLSLLLDTGYISPASHDDLSSVCAELIRMLVATVKTTRSPK
jgi:four helix bundle protein